MVGCLVTFSYTIFAWTYSKIFKCQRKGLSAEQSVNKISAASQGELGYELLNGQLIFRSNFDRKVCRSSKSSMNYFPSATKVGKRIMNPY